MGKLLILLAVLLAVVWWLRGGARGSSRNGTSAGGPAAEPAARRGAVDQPTPIVACAQCGVHLPAHEALPGRGGVFCGEAHRAVYEREHPGA